MTMTGTGPNHAAMTPAAPLRPLTGRDELALDATAAWAALDLVARLAPDLDVRALDVTTADRLVAALYRRLYGDACDCRVRCAACGEAYGFELSLREVTAAQDRDRPRPDFADGSWSLSDGRRVRAPRVADLALAPDELLARLVIAGGRGDADVLAFLERAAPTLALDLAAPCPHCGAAQDVRFDLARYLVQRLAGERPFLLREVHLIAARYGWSLAEILDLSRDDRRAFAGLIEAERATANRRRAS
jgi:hypothetical protein